MPDTLPAGTPGTQCGVCLRQLREISARPLLLCCRALIWASLGFSDDAAWTRAEQPPETARAPGSTLAGRPGPPPSVRSPKREDHR